MKGWKDILNTMLIIVLIITISLDIVNGWREKQLHQRYEKAITEYEQTNAEYAAYVKRAQERIDLMLRKAEQATLN